MTDTPTRNDRRKARTTGAILDAAGRLFHEKGFQATTIDEIAEAADVSVGSVYFHFGSKDALYLALAERALELNVAFMARAVRPDLSPLQRVLLAGEAYLAFHLEEPSAFRLIALRVLEPAGGGAAPAEVEASIADRVELLVGAVEQDLRAAIEAREVRDDLDPADAMRFLWGAWNGVIALNLRQDRLRASAAEIQAALAVGRTMILDALATPAAKRRLRPWLAANPIVAPGGR